MMWFRAVSHQLLWDNDPPDAPARLKCEEKTFVFVYFTILKIICSSLRQYREPLVTLHPFFFFPAVAKWRQRQKDVFRKHCWDYECNISSPAVWTSPEGVASLWKRLNSRDFSRLHSSWTDKHLQQFGNKISEGSCSYFVSELKELWRMCFSFWLATRTVSQLYL